MKNRLTWLRMLMTPVSVHERHGGEILSRRPRLEQPEPQRHYPIETDAAVPSPVLSGGMPAHRIALPRRPAP